MTEQEWKRRCTNRIYSAVRKAGRLRIRQLKRATHYNRGPEGESIGIWHDVLDELERRKYVVVQRDADGLEIAVELHPTRGGGTGVTTN
jgi:hypothetical protein